MEDWDQSADVIVVGLGAAGACAALEALECGAGVLVLDRFRGGGASAISGGVVYAGATAIQEAAGVADSPTHMLNYLRQEVGDVVTEQTLSKFCHESAANIQWLQDQGVPFEASLCPVKTSYPTDDFYLYYSGNEALMPYRAKATPAPRGHRAKGRGLPGRNFFDPLLRRLKEQGAQLRLQCQVTGLIKGETGAILGVEARQLSGLSARLHQAMEWLAVKMNPYRPRWAKTLRRWGRSIEKKGAPIRIQAHRGVIITTGGFIYNRDLVQEEAPKYRRGMPLGTAGCDGSGILMGRETGANTQHMDRISAWRFINPPQAWTQGILVNRSGQRYVNEALYGAAIGEAMVETQDGEGILIIDQALYDAARAQLGRGKSQWFQTAPALLNLWFARKKGHTLEALAQAARIDAAGLKASVAAYNEQIKGNETDPFLKDPESRKLLDQPPYYAIDCSLDARSFPCPTLTLGGLCVDEDSGQVLAADASPIPGLYAAGRAAVGICSRQYVSGLSLADCVFSGRRAGRHVTKEMIR
ncbi:MAG: hypothetical protein CMH55_08155 [Myxococcales bacterium]|nr:hypothetical protein [Myxococcales bacterium]